MNVERINQKIKELEYRINLDNIGLKKAEYNVINYNRLKLDNSKFQSYSELYEYYYDKRYKDICTYNALKSYLDDSSRGVNNYADDLFKCTLPYETTKPVLNYQTSITVDGNVARLFANGIDADEIIECLDNSDIKKIESDIKVNLSSDFKDYKEVGVEYVDNVDITQSYDEPIVVKYNSNNYRGLIASSKIATCFPYGKFSCKDLNGDTFIPETPSFETIKSIQDGIINKQEQYDKLHEIECKVRTKIEDSINKMDTAIAKLGDNHGITNIMKGGF